MRLIKKYQGAGKVEINNTVPQDNTQVALRGLPKINFDKFREEQAARYNTLEELNNYISHWIENTRDSALLVMLNRKSAVPVAYIKIPKEDQISEYQASIDYYRDEILKLQKKDLSLEDSTFLKFYNEELAKLQESINNLLAVKGSYITKELGPTCIMTYTDSYGHDRAIPGNRMWLSRGKSGRPVYEEKGFIMLPKGTSDLLPGDMILSVNDQGIPYHSVMYKGPEEGSDIFIRAIYSNGSVGEDSMIKNGLYGYDSDDNVFRFVGNAADSARWIKEFQNIKNRLNTKYENNQ